MLVVVVVPRERRGEGDKYGTDQCNAIGMYVDVEFSSIDDEEGSSNWCLYKNETTTNLHWAARQLDHAPPAPSTIDTLPTSP